MIGVLNINKPQGETSRDVVNRVQRLVRPAKCGHAGTLDPLATGVLVVCVGPATRLIRYVQQMQKTYVGEFLFGRSSDTEDVEGDVTLLDTPPTPSREQIEAALPALLGRIQQRPPAYSAKKIRGKRAHALARKGEQVELPPVEVTVHDLQLLAYDYPRLRLRVVCGSGVYVRSLGRDLAASLETAAVMSSLVRTAIGDFRLEQALETEGLTRDSIETRLLPPAAAVAALPRVDLQPAELVDIRHGKRIDRPPPVVAEAQGVSDALGVSDAQNANAEFAAFDPEGRFCSILTPREGGLKATLNLPS